MQRCQKKTVRDLALFGGTPAFSDPVVFGTPNIPDVGAVLDDLREVLDSRVLSNNGPRLQAFEEAVAQVSNTKHCVATDNATSALQILARALQIRGEIIVPAFTFVATANAFAWQGIQPTFVDVDPATHTIDLDSTAAAITEKTTAICGVHLWGNICDATSLSSLAEQHNLALIFDSAHALGCSNPAGVKVGNFGHAEVVSFHATKFVNAFEGGAILTNDSDLAQRLRRIRNFGFDENGRVETIGINAKMSEASAVMGFHSLLQHQQIITVNRRNHAQYVKNLNDCTGFEIVAPRTPESSNCQYVVARINEHETGISRERLLECLKAEGVLAKAYFVPPCHLQEAYRSENTQELGVSEQLAREIFCLPNGLAVQPESVDGICELIQLILDFGPEIENSLHRNTNV